MTGELIISKALAVTPERIAELKATVLDRSLDTETRLAAHMAIDAIFWARRAPLPHDYVGGEPEKITLAKKRDNARRLARMQAERITAGLPVRPRKPIGVWHSTERSDTMGNLYCINCGKPFDHWSRPRSKTCDKVCARAVHNARKRSRAKRRARETGSSDVNHEESTRP